MGSQLTQCQAEDVDTSCFQLTVSNDSRAFGPACCNALPSDALNPPPAMVVTGSYDENTPEPTFSKTSDAKLQQYLSQLVQAETRGAQSPHVLVETRDLQKPEADAQSPNASVPSEVARYSNSPPEALAYDDGHASQQHRYPANAEELVFGGVSLQNPPMPSAFDDHVHLRTPSAVLYDHVHPALQAEADQFETETEAESIPPVPPRSETELSSQVAAGSAIESGQPVAVPLEVLAQKVVTDSANSTTERSPAAGIEAHAALPKDIDDTQGNATVSAESSAVATDAARKVEPQRSGSKSRSSSKKRPKPQPSKKAVAKPEVEPKAEVPLESLDPLQKQIKLGPQSRRGNAPRYQMDVLDHHPHARDCFAIFEHNEEQYCGDWAVFYHSYSLPALLYEVNAAISTVLFGVGATTGGATPLPRLLVREFAKYPDASCLKHQFETKFRTDQRDHHPEYRAVAISAVCSLVSLGPEASTPVVFVGGYSHEDDPVDYRRLLVSLLYDLVVSHHCPKSNKSSTKKLMRSIEELTDKIIKASETHGLDVSGFGGKRCPSGKAGHLVQIFIKRDQVDALTYAAEPWGVIDKEREPLSKWLGEDSNTNWGQARILAHPEFFMQDTYVRTYVASADELFHKSRGAFQLELATLLREQLLSSAALRQSAASAIFGGSPPPRWTAVPL